jgi:DNA-binding GntR family transcriptional regulator
MAPLRMNATAIADEVGRMIESRELKPGEHIREQDLADRFGVSRGPVREALKILSSRFQVEARPNIGVTVPQLQPEEILEIHELRGEILRICAKWAALRATDAERERLLTAARELRKLADKGNVEDFLSATFNWRRLVVEASHSRRLSQAFAAQGFGSVARAWLSGTDAEAKEKMLELAADWVECSTALKARDGEKAQAIVAKVYSRDTQRLERAFAGLLHIR